MGHADVLLKELRILVNHYLLFVIFLGSGLRNDLIIRFSDIDLDKRVSNKSRFIIAERNEDSLFVDSFRLKPQRKFVGSVKNILIEEAEVGVVSKRSVYQSSTI